MLRAPQLRAVRTSMSVSPIMMVSAGSDGAAGEGGGFGDEGFEAVGIGLFGVEAVAAVVLEEETGEVEVGRRCHGRDGRVCW